MTAGSNRDDPLSLRGIAESVAQDAACHLREFLADLAGSSGDVTESIAATASTKSSPTDPVTAADTAVESLIRDRLAELRPGDPILGEEHGGATSTDGIAWVVDPIDGTVNFLYGNPWYAVSVAAVRGGVTVAGAVVEPATGRCWSAARGHGSTCDGWPLRVSRVDRPELALVATGFAYRADRRARQARFIADLLPRVRDVRRAGSAALDLCSVAAGWCDAYLEHGTNWWDWAAAALVAEEAGAVVRTPDPTGAVPDDGLGDMLLAAPPTLAAALADLARDLGAGAV